MNYAGIYKTKSHFWKYFSHGGSMAVKTNGNQVTGIVRSPGMKAEIEQGVLNGASFTFLIKKTLPLLNKTIEMKVSGSFFGDHVSGTMSAPFGTSSFEGVRVSQCS